MSPRSFRRRLDRLERSINKVKEENKDRPFKFTVDPALATALRDDYQRWLKLCQQEFNGLSAAEIEEKAMLDKRIADTAQSIRLPREYGAKEAALDTRWLYYFGRERMTPRARFTDAEYAEEAQLTARVLAFAETPEGRARKRIQKLGGKISHGKVNAAEQNEYDRLMELYPPVELPPDQRQRELTELMRPGAEKFREVLVRLGIRAPEGALKKIPPTNAS